MSLHSNTCIVYIHITCLSIDDLNVLLFRQLAFETLVCNISSFTFVVRGEKNDRYYSFELK